jgi:hypothetical protein
VVVARLRGGNVAAGLADRVDQPNSRMLRIVAFGRSKNMPFFLSTPDLIVANRPKFAQIIEVIGIYTTS